MNYYLQHVTLIEALGGYRVRATYADGFTGEVDLAGLVDHGPIFAPLRDVAYFQTLRAEDGAPVWSDDLDLSPGTLRAWCEAGRMLTMPETNAWIAEHSREAQGVA